MTRCSRLEIGVSWLLIVLTVVLMAMVTRDAWNRIGQPTPGFAVLENMLVGVGERLPPGLPLEDLGELNLRNVEARVRAFRLAAEGAVPAARVG